MSQAFLKEDAGAPGAPRRTHGLPPRGHPDCDAAAAEAVLEAARAGATASAEQATGYYSGEPKLRPHVARLLAGARAAQDERLVELAERCLR